LTAPKLAGTGCDAKWLALQQHLGVGVGKGLDLGRVGHLGGRVGLQRGQPAQELLGRGAPNTGAEMLPICQDSPPGRLNCSAMLRWPLVLSGALGLAPPTEKRTTTGTGWPLNARRRWTGRARIAANCPQIRPWRRRPWRPSGGSPRTCHGLIMDKPLMIASIIRHAARYHTHTEIVARTIEGGLFRYTYGEAHARICQVANALKQLGVQPGDRVGTLAWNSDRHLALYFGVSGAGAVLHTVNPRLFPEQIDYIINHAEDRVLFFDITFAPLVARLAPLLKTVKACVAMTDRAHMPAIDAAEPAVLGRPGPRAAHRLHLAGARRAQRVVAVLHLGHHRQPQGRAVFAPLGHPHLPAVRPADRPACEQR
jgi:hypothetical protein